VLRVLGNLLGLAGFDFETSEDVLAEAVGDGTGIAARLSNKTAAPVSASPAADGIERIADVPIYAVDAVVRRAHALQHTADAQPPAASLSPEQWAALGLPATNAAVRVTQGGASVVLPAQLDATLARNVVRVPAGHGATAALAAMFGPIEVEKAEAA
jgi:NADH-quinone oxidoreductase subunit G